MMADGGNGAPKAHKFAGRLTPGWGRVCAICGAERDQHAVVTGKAK